MRRVPPRREPAPFFVGRAVCLFDGKAGFVFFSYADLANADLSERLDAPTTLAVKGVGNDGQILFPGANLTHADLSGLTLAAEAGDDGKIDFSVGPTSPMPICI